MEMVRGRGGKSPTNGADKKAAHLFEARVGKQDLARRRKELSGFGRLAFLAMAGTPRGAVLKQKPPGRAWEIDAAGDVGQMRAALPGLNWIDRHDLCPDVPDS